VLKYVKTLNSNLVLNITENLFKSGGKWAEGLKELKATVGSWQKSKLSDLF
jgi:hypothetical protein